MSAAGPQAMPSRSARGTPRAWREHGSRPSALLIAPVVAPPFWITLLNYIGLYSIVALGLVLLTGVAGQTSFGQAAFVGIGAYTTAYPVAQLSGDLAVAQSRRRRRAHRG